MRRVKQPESPSWCFQGAPRWILELEAAFGTTALCPKPNISSVVLQLNLNPWIYLGSGCLFQKHLEAVQPYLLISH